MARVFSQKHSSTSMGNVGINSVGTKSVYQKWQSSKNRMFRGCLAGRLYPWVTRKTQLSPSVLTLRIPVMCKTYASFCGMFSRELPVKYSWNTTVSIYFDFSHSSNVQGTCIISWDAYSRDTRKTQLSPSGLTLRIPVMCKAHATFRRMLSRELLAKSL